MLLWTFQFPKSSTADARLEKSKKKKRERTAEHVGQSQHFITSSEHETDTSNVLFRSLSSDSLNKGARPPRLFHLKQHVQKQPSQDLASHASLSCSYPHPCSLFAAAKVSYLQGKKNPFITRILGQQLHTGKWLWSIASFIFSLVHQSFLSLCSLLQYHPLYFCWSSNSSVGCLTSVL